MNQRTRNIILWIVAIGLLISMAISFTPGQLFGNNTQNNEGAVALDVNGRPIYELDVARLEQQAPFNAVQEGPVADDLQLVLLDELVSQSLIQQAASGENVSNGEVRDQVNEFRASQNVAGRNNDRAYLSLLSGAGYTDETFRELMREQLQQEKYIASLTEGVEVTDEELTTFFEANRDAYQTEPRITAREIVVTDQAEADRLYALALSGEDFATLARENSSERAEQGGALGASDGESAPQPVTSVALPTAVAEAAFALQGPGLTTPIQAGGAYHIVSVEAFTPAAPRPLDEVREEVRTDALELKKSGVQEAELLKLRNEATITAPEGSTYSYDDPVVARVGDDEIKATELDRATYLNPQIQQLLNPESADLIVSFLKPNNLSQLIDQELAYQGASELGAAFVGTRAAIAQSARSYVGRDEAVTPAQVQEFYTQNQANFTVPPAVLATRVNFPDRDAATSFTQALDDAATVGDAAIKEAADAAGGTVETLGSVTQGSQPEVIDAALFNFTDGMTALGESGYDVSEVLSVSTPPDPASGGAASGGAVSGGAVSGGAASGGSASGGANAAPSEQFVVLVAARSPSRVRPLNEVRALAEQAALVERQTTAQQTWLDGLREKITVEDLLAQTGAEAPSEAEQTAAATGAAAAAAAASGAASGGATNSSALSGGAVLPVAPPEPSGGAN